YLPPSGTDSCETAARGETGATRSCRPRGAERQCEVADWRRELPTGGASYGVVALHVLDGDGDGDRLRRLLTVHDCRPL
ncbi:unnamed protein product, partial [Urochloa humidicola]